MLYRFWLLNNLKSIKLIAQKDYIDEKINGKLLIDRVQYDLKVNLSIEKKKKCLNIVKPSLLIDSVIDTLKLLLYACQQLS